MIRYRMLDANDDYVFGQGPSEFLVDSPQAVLQAIRTRFRLFEGEFFIDTSAGTPWFTDILGENTQPLYDAAIQERILATIGVASLSEYASVLNKDSRGLSVQARVVPVNFPGVIKPTVGRLDIDFVLDFSLLG